MNFDNMKPDYDKSKETEAQKMARQVNKNVFIAVTAGVFISLGFAVLIFVVFLNMGFISINKRNADGTRGAVVNADKITEINSKLDNFYYSDEVDSSDLQEGMYKGYVSAYGDPYTTYYTADEYTKFTDSYAGKTGGIGVKVNFESGKGLVVNSIVDNSPAQNEGMQAGDIITSIDGVDIVNATSEEALNRLRGNIGEDVTITYTRNGETKTATLNRIELQTTTALGTMLEGTTIGYISISHFEQPTSEQFKTELDKLKSQGMTSLIIDLRDNTGGLVSSAVQIMDILMPAGNYGTQVHKDGSVYEFTGTSSDSLDMPIVLLVNGNSASSSEIMTAAMKDLGKATIVGTKTYGKGITQKFEALSDGSGIVYTDAELRSPNGTTWHEVGITPDIVVEYDENASSDTQLQAAIDHLKK